MNGLGLKAALCGLAIFAVSYATVGQPAKQLVQTTKQESAAKQSVSPAKATAAKKPAAKSGTTAADAVAERAIGLKSAPITMEVFSDYQCPACREFYLSTVRQVIENYVSAGKVYLIHRDMPLQMHPFSREAARYANAAARVKKLEPVVQVLFSKQEMWVKDGNIDGVVASVLTGAEIRKVRALVQGGTLETAIESDVALGNRFRVTQTPTTIITHRGQQYFMPGMLSFTVLRGFLNELLSK